MMNETCCCGHVYDEHNAIYLTCEIDDCYCIYFEADEGEDD